MLPNIFLPLFDDLVQVCPICLTNPKDMAFGCGHQVNHSLVCHYDLQVAGLYSEIVIIMHLSSFLFSLSFCLADMFWLWRSAPAMPHLPELNWNQNKALLVSFSAHLWELFMLSIYSHHVWVLLRHKEALKMQICSEILRQLTQHWTAIGCTGVLKSSVIVCVWVRFLEVCVNFYHMAIERLGLSWKFIMDDDFARNRLQVRLNFLARVEVLWVSEYPGAFICLYKLLICCS